MRRDSPPGAQDIPLQPPIAQHGELVPAVEDRSYLLYIGGALAIALAAGFVLATLLPLASAGTLPWATRVPRLIQAHGWAQLQGWAGLFVAGMGLRLMPRFAGRRPLPVRITFPISVAFFAGTVGRTAVQVFVEGRIAEILFVVTGWLAAAAMIAVGLTLAWTLTHGRRRREAWRYLALAGSGWWVAWGILTVIATWRGANAGLLIPTRLDDTMTWIVMLGVVGNFIWGVQSRSVPIFFGRKTPSLRAAAIPAVLLNAGAVVLVVATVVPAGEIDRLVGLGLGLSGLALVGLAPLAGSLWGSAHRLRPRSRAAARYVLAANWSAEVCGVLLIGTGFASALTGNYELFAWRDAARHAFGVGVITLLILGMARLIAPVFALERAEATKPTIADQVSWWTLLCAAVLRVAGALLLGHMDEQVRHWLVSTSGGLAWIGLAGFAFSVISAVRKEPRMRALLMGTPRSGA